MGYGHIIETLDDASKDREFYAYLMSQSQSRSFDALDHVDWDFEGYTTQYLTHKFHSYPARFIPQIPLTFIELFTEPGETVLDPFCGCGTTIVEAFMNNRAGIGNDFNPLATLISNAKTTIIPSGELDYLRSRVSSINTDDVDSAQITEWRERLPNRRLSELFTEPVIITLESIKKTISELRNRHKGIFDLARVALSASIYNLVEHEGVSGIRSLFARKLDSMICELRVLDRLVSEPPRTQVLTGDARRLEVPDRSVALVVTSPPYVNALDYYRMHMYNMLWLDMDFGLFKKNEIGAHSQFISNRFRLLSQYLGDMLRAMIEMNRVLVEDGVCAIVVGNSSLEYELIESHRFFVSMSQEIGFKMKKTLFRNIDTAKKYTSKEVGNIDDEYILVLQKQNDCAVSSTDDEFIVGVVYDEMKTFEQQIKKIQGTSIVGRSPSKKRLKDNISRIADAIERIPEDTKMKA